MHGPHPINHHSTVAALFGPTASLGGSLGTPSTPGVVEIHAAGRLLGDGPTFQEAISAASKRAADLAGELPNA